MLGAIIGDTVGSVYEFNNKRSKNFELLSKYSEPTDDSIMTLAVAECLQKRIYNDSEKIVETLKKWGRAYPNAGYGGRFAHWLFSDNIEPYYSFGNGAAMRISPVAWYARSEEEVKKLAKTFTEVTHNHPEGLKGAEVTAMCIYYAKIGKTKEFIKEYVEQYYDMNFDYEGLKKNYKFNETCQESVPQAIYCFLISNSFEDCLRTTISIGGDCDTTSAISCAIAEAYYKNIDTKLIVDVLKRIPMSRNNCNPMNIIEEFRSYQAYHNANCEEITDKTLVLGVEAYYDDKKEIELFYSKNIKVLGENLIFYNIDLIIGLEDDDLAHDYYNERNIDKYFITLYESAYPEKLYRNLNQLCGLSRMASENPTIQDLLFVINGFNELFIQHDINVKIKLFDNVDKAMKYVGEEYKIYNAMLKDIYTIKIE